MAAMIRGGALIACTAVIVGVSAGVAQAAVPQPAPAPAPLHQVDQNAYNAAIAAQQTDMINTLLGDTGAGTAVGCVVGGAAGLVGLVVLPAVLFTVPAGCALGGVTGSMIGLVTGELASNGVYSQTEPNVMQACLTAMPKVACQIVENDRLHSSN